MSWCCAVRVPRRRCKACAAAGMRLLAFIWRFWEVRLVCWDRERSRGRVMLEEIGWYSNTYLRSQEAVLLLRKFRSVGSDTFFIDLCKLEYCLALPGGSLCGV